jgi:hypothetical protein
VEQLTDPNPAKHPNTGQAGAPSIMIAAPSGSAALTPRPRATRPSLAAQAVLLTPG